MAKKNNGEPAAEGAAYARLETSAEDKTKAAKWFQRARELGDIGNRRAIKQLVADYGGTQR